MARATLFIISLFLLASCGQNQAPSSLTTINVTLGTDSSKTIEQNKKPTSFTTDTTSAFKSNDKPAPAFAGTTFKLAPPKIKDSEDEDDDDEDDDDEDDEKDGKYYYLYKRP